MLLGNSTFNLLFIYPFTFTHIWFLVVDSFAFFTRCNSFDTVFVRLFDVNSTLLGVGDSPLLVITILLFTRPHIVRFPFVVVLWRIQFSPRRHTFWRVYLSLYILLILRCGSTSPHSVVLFVLLLCCCCWALSLCGLVFVELPMLVFYSLIQFTRCFVRFDVLRILTFCIWTSFVTARCLRLFSFLPHATHPSTFAPHIHTRPYPPRPAHHTSHTYTHGVYAHLPAITPRIVGLVYGWFGRLVVPVCYYSFGVVGLRLRHYLTAVVLFVRFPCLPSVWRVSFPPTGSFWRLFGSSLHTRFTSFPHTLPHVVWFIFRSHAFYTFTLHSHTFCSWIGLIKHGTLDCVRTIVLRLRFRSAHTAVHACVLHTSRYRSVVAFARAARMFTHTISVYHLTALAHTHTRPHATHARKRNTFYVPRWRLSASRRSYVRALRLGVLPLIHHTFHFRLIPISFTSRLVVGFPRYTTSYRFYAFYVLHFGPFLGLYVTRTVPFVVALCYVSLHLPAICVSVLFVRCYLHAPFVITLLFILFVICSHLPRSSVYVWWRVRCDSLFPYAFKRYVVLLRYSRWASHTLLLLFVHFVRSFVTRLLRFHLRFPPFLWISHYICLHIQ